MAFNITVEPVIFLYMLSSFMLLTGVQDLVYVKVCFSKYSAKICNNLYDPLNEDALAEVQSHSSYWILGINLLLYTPTIFSAQFIGSWSDSYGTKLPMIIPGLGGVISSLLYIFQCVYLKSSPLYLLPVTSCIAGFMGDYTTCIMTCVNYISKTTETAERTSRVSILEGAIYVAGCLGPLLVGWIKTSLGRTFIFVAIMLFQSLLTIYIVIFIRDIKPSSPSGDNWLKRAFEFSHLKDSLSTAVKWRPDDKRLYLFLFMLGLAFVKCSHAMELDISYIYVKDKPIAWGLSSFTRYLSLKYGIGAASALFLLPRLRHLPDALLLVIGLSSQILGLILLGFAVNSTSMYAVAVVFIFNSWSVPVIRSASSKLVEDDEKVSVGMRLDLRFFGICGGAFLQMNLLPGKLFACFAVVENIFGMTGSLFSDNIYPLTRAAFHGLVFIVAACFLTVPLGLTCFFYGRLKQLSTNSTSSPELEAAKEDDETLLSPS